MLINGKSFTEAAQFSRRPVVKQLCKVDFADKSTRKVAFKSILCQFKASVTSKQSQRIDMHWYRHLKVIQNHTRIDTNQTQDTI